MELFSRAAQTGGSGVKFLPASIERQASVPGLSILLDSFLFSRRRVFHLLSFDSSLFKAAA